MLQPDAAARVKGGKDRREIAAKVLVRRPSSFPGIKEPTQPGGVPRSEAKALLECRRLVPPAGGRLLQGMDELCPALPIARGWRSCALHCPSYCQGMEEMCPGAVPCTALPITRGWRSCALELCPALPFLLPGDGGDVPWSCALHCPAGAPGAPELRQCRPQPQDSQHSPWQPGWSSSGPALPSATRWICLASRARLPNARPRGGNRPRALRWARTKGSPRLLSRGLLWTGPLRCLSALDTPQRQPRRTQRIQPALGSVGTAGLQSSAGSHSQGPPPRAPPRPPRVSRPPQIPALPAGAQQPAAALKPGPCALSGTKSRARALGDA
ncbi:uncharacterized protein LOC127465214 isoform X1 [Manacus candei]|uniref:uncharacterized protein LOC127465214 isoform X1 n=1 Tax=Manacus candei TaxID=415023 RepID=UPI002225ECF5|nr:uncharacterized protein LOC127465214 isoform X1 [Manacus candei]